MKTKIGTAALWLLLFTSSSWADTLYQANVGTYSVGSGYTGTGDLGAGYTGLGVGLPSVNNGGYYGGTAGVPSEGTNFPSNTQCCGSCNQCNNCSNGYATGCR